MLERFWLIVWLITWVIATVLVIRDQWNPKVPSIGLPIIYLLSLSIIHLFGALIYAFPWYTPTNPYLVGFSDLARTTAGFTETTYGVIGFAYGSIILAPWILKTTKPSWLYEQLRQPSLKLPKTLIYIGLFFLALAPILGRLPSFTAISTSGIALFIVGLCLSCWKAWQMGNQRAFMQWLLITCSMPVFTISILGFLGFGVAAASIVLVFVFNFYRPRWKLIIITLLVLLLGLSIFVTYLRDRSEIRSRVWGGESSQARVEQIWQTFREFEIFDPFKQEHLELIDMRLNQNVLIGQSVNYLKDKNVDFAHGETLLGAAIALIPRIFWPNKPVRGGSGNLVTRYTGQEFAAGTSVGVGQVLEFYINFGSWGVIIGFIIFGTLLRIIDITAGQKLIHGNWMGFTSWLLPGLGLINPGGSLVEIVASTAASLVFIYCLNQLYRRKKNSQDIRLLAEVGNRE
ncbi:hypothetical protein [Moorena producens]|uniref:hypothetical protein n=1 Tax=Moorena producens TaxID=1155739 RepID=UPI003C7293E3